MELHGGTWAGQAACSTTMEPWVAVVYVPNALTHVVSQVGFLFLRYVCDPKQLWGWVERYINDQEVGELGSPTNHVLTCMVVVNAAGPTH